MFKKKEKVSIGLRNELGYLNLNTRFWQHLLIAIGGYFLMTILISLISKALLTFYISKGMDFSCIIGGESTGVCNQESLFIYQKITMLSQVLAQLSIVAIVVAIFYKHLASLFKQAKEKKTWIWFAIGLVIIAIFDLSYAQILKSLGLDNASSNQEAVIAIAKSFPFIGFLLISIVGPLFEEVIFRFGIYRTFLNKGKKLEIAGLIITTILFALIHMEATLIFAFSDIANPNWDILFADLCTLPPYLFIAFAITFTYYKSKNLFTPMILHMTWNFLQFVLIVITAMI